MTEPPPPPGEPPPMPDLRPSFPPATPLRPTNLPLLPSASSPCHSSCAADAPLPELRPSLAGVGSHDVVPSFDGLDMASFIPLANEVDEEEIQNYGRGFMATGGSFGKVTSLELIQARQHLLNVERELLKSKFAQEMVHVSDDDALSSHEVSDDGGKEDGEFEEDSSLTKDEAFRNLMNGALRELRQEQEDIRQVDAILGQVERDRARKGKNVLPASWPESGAGEFAAGESIPRGCKGARVASSLAEPHKPLEGITLANSNSNLVSTSPITSIPSFTPIPSFTSSFPSLTSNSNSKTTIPSSCFPPYPSRPLSTRTMVPPSGSSGQDLTGQPLTGQTLTITNFSPILSEPPPLPRLKLTKTKPNQPWAVLLMAKHPLHLGLILLELHLQEWSLTLLRLLEPIPALCLYGKVLPRKARPFGSTR